MHKDPHLYRLNVGLRLTLEYLAISSSSESHVHSPLSKSIFKHEYLIHKDPRLYTLRRDTRGDLTRIRTGLNSHKEITSPSIQNLKVLSL